jgi:hypothetical protein
MKHAYSEKRRHMRFLVAAGTKVELNKNGKTVRATTVNMSVSGVLLHFVEQVQLSVGDRVTCDFNVTNEVEKPLPYWGVGNVVRVLDCEAAIELKSGRWSRVESETDCTEPQK